MNVAKLIVIEGNDGAGKATQVAMLVERFRREGLNVETFDFPRYKKNTGGKVLAEMLKSERASDYDFVNLDPRAASLFYAIDRMESQDELKKALTENDLVILDRYISSNVIHQGGKIKDKEEKIDFVNWLLDLEYNKLKNLKPDAVILLTIPFTVSMQRTKDRAEKEGLKPDAVEANLDYIKNSSESGEYFADMLDWQKVSGVDGERERSREEINDEIYKIIKINYK